MDGTPELRVADADREQVAERLRSAAGEGRLTVDELDERLDAAFAARTRADLDRLVADLPADPHPGAAARPLPVVPGEGGTRWIISIMSGHDRRGRWRVGPKVININFWGGSDLDFNDAELSAVRTEVRIFSIMGGAAVYVPDGLEVEISQFALMGGNDVELGAARPAPGGPVLHLRLFSLWGGTDVRRGRRLSRAERRAQRLHERND
jgi:catechol 2,3-dioxygenase-like lactoylglutathione lyase family enzyme